MPERQLRTLMSFRNSHYSRCWWPAPPGAARPDRRTEQNTAPLSPSLPRRRLHSRRPASRFTVAGKPQSYRLENELTQTPMILHPRLRSVVIFLSGLACALLGVLAYEHYAPTGLAGDNAAAGLSGSAGAPPDRFAREGVWAQIADQNQAVMNAPTPAPRSPRLALPWTHHRAVLLAVDLQEVGGNPGMARLYRDFLEAVLPVTRVIVLYHRKNGTLVPAWLHQLETSPTLAPLLSKMDFVPAEVSSKWVRDFGPIFGVDRAKHLLVLDPAYIDPRIELSNYLTTEGLDTAEQRARGRAALSRELERLRGDDISPAILAANIQVQDDISTLLVRPPLILEGGDLMPVDARTALVSRSTLEANGGRTYFVEDTLKRYFGIDHVHYLQCLPGETIEHIDFIVQIISPTAILAAAPPTFDPGASTARQLLKEELDRRLRANLAYLRKHFPHHEIVEVPLPPPLLSRDDAIVQQLFVRVLFDVGRKLGLQPAQVIQSSGDGTAPSEVANRVLEQLSRDTGMTDFHSLSAKGDAVAAYRHRPLADLVAGYADTYTIYRSYLNSLLVCGDGGERIIVPRFQPQTEDERPLLEQLERQVAAAYHRARPGAQLVWIDCTAIAPEFGAVHCFASTVPDPAALGVK